MCSNALTSDRSVICSSELSVICSSELSVICSSKNVVVSYTLRHFASPDGCHQVVSHTGRAASSSARARKASALQGGTLVGDSRRRKKFRLMSLFRTRPAAQSATVRFGTHHSRRLSCALSGGISTEPCHRNEPIRDGSWAVLISIKRCTSRNDVLLLRNFKGADEKTHGLALAQRGLCHCSTGSG